MELLERVGLRPSFGERYPAQLSGGQQQRVGVARALAADPPVMLMDEPFSAVDPVVRDQLQDEFLRLQGELGKTIVFVTHDIDEAIKLGDQVAVLRVGGHARPGRRAGLPAGPPGRRLRRRLRRARPRLPRRWASRPRRACRCTPEPTVGPLGETPAEPSGRTGPGCWSTTQRARWAGSSPRGVDRDLQPADAAPRRHRRLGDRFAARRARRGPVLAEPAGRGRRRRRRACAARSRAHEVLTAIEEADRPEVARGRPGARRWGLATLTWFLDHRS